MESVSIIVITLNEAERIGNILGDLSRQTHQKFEVIVVDSDSDDNTRELAKEFDNCLPKLTVHRMNIRGVSLGRNTGATLAIHNRLLFLDADTRLPADFLAKSLKQLQKRRLDVAGVFMHGKDLPAHLRFGYAFFNMGFFVTQFGFPTSAGACIFSKKVVHDKVKGFDERLSLCEDCDYVNRASKVSRFRMLPTSFRFDPRRLNQDGFFQTGWTYLQANLRRFVHGELLKNEIEYKFNHYRP